MQKYKSYNCNVCTKKYTDLSGWTKHMKTTHPEEIPSGYTPARYFYYLKTGKTHGKCVICGKDTMWNEGPHKYERFCKNPKCKDEYREIFKKRMMDRYGKVHLLDDPNIQREMVAARKISGTYTFKDGGKIGYVGKYEEDFLKMLDLMVGFNSGDIMGPSPHNYEYDYKNPNDKENEGKKIYIPDFFIPSINAEIEIKSHTNMHHKIQNVDRVKEKCKDVTMSKLPNRNYIKVIDKDYSDFFKFLIDLKDQHEEEKSTKEVVVESIVEVERNNEVILESIMNYRGDIVQENFILDMFTKFQDIIQSPYKTAISDVKNLVSTIPSQHVSVDKKKQYITIKGINIKRFFAALDGAYGEKSIKKLFIVNYNSRDVKRFNNKQIPRAKMKIESIKVPIFFALELTIIFDTLYKKYNTRAYRSIVLSIYRMTWLSKSDELSANKLPLKNLDRIDTRTLLAHQKEFIEQYPALKTKLNLKGYINAFEQGMGKTLTAVGLSECLDVDRVFILCPKSLTVNWTNEIRSYYGKYVKDKALWEREVVICQDNPKDILTAKFIITNNESIEKMYPYIVNNKKNMFILDESHNFRNFGGKRVQQLFELVEKIDSQDNLIMSGTPIKATPNEIVPALYVIDPVFTMEAAEIYDKCFKLNNTEAMQIVQKRFGMIIHRKTKAELGLPNKSVHNLSYTISDSDKYSISNCREEIVRLFHEIYTEKMKSHQVLKIEFLGYINKYSSATVVENKKYIKWVEKNVNTDSVEYLHELDMSFMQSFVSTFVRPNIKNSADLNRVVELEKTFLHMDRSAMGLAIGKVIPPRRSEMFIKLYMENKDVLLPMIENNPKKVIIFSQFKPVVQAIAKDLNNEGIKTVLITGDNTSDRNSLLDEFHNDDNVQVLCATSQTMSTGVTLVEANKTFFFGPPWRSTDFEQASDRIHRIGQTSDVDIYLVSLDSGAKKNLSTRMMDIMSWSQDMFDSAIKEDSDIDEKAVFESLYEFDNVVANVLDKYYDVSDELALEAINAIRKHVPVYTTSEISKATTDTKKYPIYVVLMHSGTLLANAIQKTTGHEYSHACIAFNLKLNPLYSFGRKDMSMLDTGFVMNYPQHDFFRKFKTKYAVYKIMVDRNGLERMKNRMGYFEKNSKLFKYDIPGLVYNFIGVEREKTNKYFCSRFVADIINSGVGLNKNVSLYKPNEFKHIDNIELVSKGDDFYKYKWR